VLLGLGQRFALLLFVHDGIAAEHGICPVEFPEIIEDICNGYLRKFGSRIHDEVSAALRPCIVKFEVADEDTESLIPTVLNYCLHKEYGQELAIGTNTCYDGKGEAIPRSAIRKIEFPHYRRAS